MSVCIFTDGRRAVFSQFNGGSYELRMTGNKSVLLQGDDATDWRKEYDAADEIDDTSRSHRCKIDLVERYFGNDKEQTND